MLSCAMLACRTGSPSSLIPETFGVSSNPFPMPPLPSSSGFSPPIPCPGSCLPSLLLLCPIFPTSPSSSTPLPLSTSRYRPFKLIEWRLILPRSQADTHPQSPTSRPSPRSTPVQNIQRTDPRQDQWTSRRSRSGGLWAVRRGHAGVQGEVYLREAAAGGAGVTRVCTRVFGRSGAHDLFRFHKWIRQMDCSTSNVLSFLK